MIFSQYGGRKVMAVTISFPCPIFALQRKYNDRQGYVNVSGSWRAKACNLYVTLLFD
jgi:hypothetical protein